MSPGQIPCRGHVAGGRAFSTGSGNSVPYLPEHGPLLRPVLPAERSGIVGPPGALSGLPPAGARNAGRSSGRSPRCAAAGAYCGTRRSSWAEPPGLASSIGSVTPRSRSLISCPAATLQGLPVPQAVSVTSSSSGCERGLRAGPVESLPLSMASLPPRPCQMLRSHSRPCQPSVAA